MSRDAERDPYMGTGDQTQWHCVVDLLLPRVVFPPAAFAVGDPLSQRPGPECVTRTPLELVLVRFSHGMGIVDTACAE